ncbi:MAG TPA: hypothetical protein VMF55_07145 [Solirubrobacterales bacterium]|nr:hypothetical protein [Solirubrobacterales bacterium]
MKRLMLMVCGAVVAVAVAICVLGLTAGSAKANQVVETASVDLSGPGGDFDHLAGAHPDLTFSFGVATRLTKEGAEWPAEGVHDVNLELPPGLVGNPTSVPACPLQDFYRSTQSSTTQCQVASQVGWVVLRASNSNQIQEPKISLYNLAASPDQPARFAFLYLGVPVFIGAGVRPGDYGIDSGSRNTDQTLGIMSVTVHLWGVPALSSHDAERLPFGYTEYPVFVFPTSSPAPPKPLLRNPTFCGAAEPFNAKVDSWEHPGAFDVKSLSADPGGVPFAFEDCGALSFKPTLAAHPTSSSAASPTGLQVEITVPQNESPAGQSTADVRKVVTTLPAGMSVSDSSAQGLGACSIAQIGIGSNDPPACPDAAKIGTVRIKTPLLEEELEGAVYLAQQKENPFGTTLALYMAVKGPGFYLKLPGRVDADPTTGQLTATFDNTPQLPFEKLQLELKPGPRAPLVNPSRCGTYAVKSEIVPWSGAAPVTGESTFQVNEGCSTGGFNPVLKAGTADPNGGAYSSFLLRVLRNDGEGNISRIDANLPEGLLAKLAGVPLCGDAQAATGDCPAASQIGQTTVGAGAGPTPVFVPEAGKAPTAVYLAGPYRGAPYSLVVKVPAQAGPFDLGTVAVRSSISIDPVTTAVSVKSDPLPQILEGIPVSYRDIRVEVDRQGFTLNPTSCEAKRITSTITSAEGATATPSVPFAAANCDRLGLQPKLAFKFSGAPTRRGGHPKLTATLTTKKGDSNLRRVQVTLPGTEYLENAHIKTVCTRVQYAASQCPQKSIYGYAKAWTPLLDKPLEGPVYLRSSNHKLPDLVASLDGQIHVDLDGRISSNKSRIRNTFDFVPDAPVTKFVLTMQGGGKGLLVNNTNICKAKPVAEVEFNGQNGKVANTKPRVQVAGCGKGGKKAKGK